jgi:hypothetical protein
VVEGRNFTDGDGADALPVVIINQAFARRLFHNLDPVGQYIVRFDTNLLIAGVVTDTVGSTVGGLGQDVAPLAAERTIYIPAAQIDDGKSLYAPHLVSAKLDCAYHGACADRLLGSQILNQVASNFVFFRFSSHLKRSTVIGI